MHSFNNECYTKLTYLLDFKITMTPMMITINSINIAIMNVPIIIGGAITKSSTFKVVIAVPSVTSVVSVKRMSLFDVAVICLVTGTEGVNVKVVKFMVLTLVVCTATTEDGIEAVVIVGLILMIAERLEITAAS